MYINDITVQVWLELLIHNWVSPKKATVPFVSAFTLHHLCFLTAWFYRSLIFLFSEQQPHFFSQASAEIFSQKTHLKVSIFFSF